jgi:hypothetical protein
MTKPIQITKRAGEILNRESVLKQLEARFGTLRNGEYTLSLSRQEKRRTLAENRLFWLWMACMEKKRVRRKRIFTTTIARSFSAGMSRSEAKTGRL